MGPQPGRPSIVRPATRADLPAIAGVLARAFQTEPVYGWLWSDPERRRRRLPGYMRALVTHLHAGLGPVEVTVAGERAGERVVGVAVWDRPGRAHPGRVRTARAMPGLVRAVGTRLGRLGELADTLDRARPAEPHWYLSHLGVDPAAQRSGAGSALLASMLPRIDAEGRGTYLECRPENVSYYERVGFGLGAEVGIEPGVLSLLTMWRPPAR